MSATDLVTDAQEQALFSVTATVPVQGAEKALKEIPVRQPFSSAKEQRSILHLKTHFDTCSIIALYFFFIKLATMTLQSYTSDGKIKASNNFNSKGQALLLESRNEACS